MFFDINQLFNEAPFVVGDGGMLSQQKDDVKPDQGTFIHKFTIQEV